VASSGFLLPTPLVSNSLGRSTVRHDFVTDSSRDSVTAITERLRTLGTKECHSFRESILFRHAQLANAIASNYEAIAKEHSYVEANRSLLSLNDRLTIHDLNLSGSAEELLSFAKIKAAECSDIASKLHYSDKAYDLCSEVAEKYDITPPQAKDYQGDLYPCTKRLCCHRWWRRKITTKQSQTIESVARDLGLVSHQRSAYCSPISQNKRSQQKARTEQYLKNTIIENETGETFSLKDIHDRSVSNPRVRRAELMTRIKGFEMVSEQLGHIGEFYTISTPSRMHARLKRGRANPKYDGTTPDEAHRYLTEMFKLIRSKLHRDGCGVYGIRVVEPHHDGTPHWHLLLFMPAELRSKVRATFRKYALMVDGEERGAQKYRFKAEAIDRERGSATGYVAKYIAKNIDGEFIEEDLHGNDARRSAKAIDAWASTYRIRQFQFFGGPSVTVWRELRRLTYGSNSEALANVNTALKADENNKVIIDAGLAADAADWAAFVMVMGGINTPAHQRPIHSLYQESLLVDEETGEVFEDSITNYGNPKPPRLVGLKVNGTEIITRTCKWVLKQASVLITDSHAQRDCCYQNGAIP